MIVRAHAHARAGLLGNPSDGFFGKTIALEVRNFRATVTMWESPWLEIVPNPAHDPTRFDSLDQLVTRAQTEGYYGGLRLLLATCTRFASYCRAQGIALPARNFTMVYETNIPRQVGLGGSSAIVCAMFRALMKFYEVPEERIPLPLLPRLLLEVESRELGIQAGLQDRVIVAYGGLVYMDFSRELMESQGHGRYERMDPALLPRLFIAYGPPSAESGRAHNPVRFRWEQGDPEVRQAMEQFASYAEQGKAALQARDYETLGELMDKNFDLRRKVYGDEVIGERNLRLVNIARSLGLPVKFPGSGGAVIGMYRSEEEWEKLREAYAAEGFEVVSVCPLAEEQAESGEQ